MVPVPLLVRAGMCGQLLAELIALDVFVDGLVELLGQPAPPTNPVITFANERSTWA